MARSTKGFTSILKFTLNKLLKLQLRKFVTVQSVGMELPVVVEALNKIAPVKLAESWDNVGLLVEPSSPHYIKNILLTNDLTEHVMEEAVGAKSNLIISYHPPIFRPIKRLTAKSWKERIVIRALENRIAVYSPHTASDAVQDGVNDWLASGLGEHCILQPITQRAESASSSLLRVNMSKDFKEAQELINEIKESGDVVETSGDSLEVACKKENLKTIMIKLEKYGLSTEHVHYMPTCEVPLLHTGAGRICELQKPVSLATIVQRVKAHLQLEHLRLAIGKEKSLENSVKTVALCAGSGAGVLSGCQADVYLTGEMSHHEVLEAIQNGISVILCEHSNTERGYLHVLKKKLFEILGSNQLSIRISKVDRDPLVVV